MECHERNDYFWNQNDPRNSTDEKRDIARKFRLRRSQTENSYTRGIPIRLHKAQRSRKNSKANCEDNQNLVSPSNMKASIMKFLFTIICLTSQSFVQGGGLRGALESTIESLTPNALRKLADDYYLSSELIEHEHDGDPSYDFIDIVDKIQPHDRIDSDAYHPLQLITDLIGRLGGLLPGYDAPESYEITLDDQYDGKDGGEHGGKLDADFLQYMNGDPSNGVPIMPEEDYNGSDILNLLQS